MLKANIATRSIRTLKESWRSAPELSPRSGIDKNRTSKVAQEFTCDLEIALLIRVRHVWSVLPLPGPLNRSSQIHRIIDHPGVNQSLTILAETETFREAFLRAAG